MKATCERTPGSRVVLEIEVPPEEAAPDIQDAFRRLARQVKIPGFRPGKAPAANIERALGRPRILQEALNPLVSRVYREALTEQGFVAVEAPAFEVGAFTDGEPLRFTAAVAIRPEVRLPDYAAVHVPLEPKEVGAEDVERALQDLRRRRAAWVPVEAPAADGDLVLLTTTGLLTAGQRVAERRAEGVLGSGQLRPQIDAAVRGLQPGAAAELDLAFPEDDPVVAVRGQSAHLRVQLHEIKRQELPALDDALAADISEAQTLEELRAELGNTLRQRAEADAARVALNTAVDRIVDATEVDLPEVWVARGADNLLADLQSRLAASRVAFPAYLEAQGKTAAQLRDDLRPAAARSVKTSLVLEALARDAGLWPGDPAVEAEIERQAGKSGLQPSHYRRLADRPDNRAAIASELARTAALQWLEAHALPAHAQPAPEPAPAAP